MLINRLILACFLSFYGCCKSDSTSEWITTGIDSNDFVAVKINLIKVPSELKDKSISLLDNSAFVVIPPNNLGEYKIAQKSNYKYILCRSVIHGEENHYIFVKENKFNELIIIHGCLSSGVLHRKKNPIILEVARLPKNIYVKCDSAK